VGIDTIQMTPKFSIRAACLESINFIKI